MRLRSRTGSVLGRVSAMVLTAAAASVVTGCSPSPTTTYSDTSGKEVTVDWADYPGHAYTEAAEVLAAPREEEIEPIAAEIFGRIESRLGAEYTLQWTGSGEAGWYPAGGNGYGGDSGYLTYNSAGRASDTIPREAADWHRIVQIVSGVTAEYDLGPVVLDHESPSFGDDKAWQQELGKRYGTDDPDEYWSWSGTAYGGSQWLSISLTDVARDLTGKAAAEHEESGWAPNSISFSYGATTLPDGHRESFERALAPFAGLDKPEATTSD